MVAELKGHGCGIGILFNSAGLRNWDSLLIPHSCGIGKTGMLKKNTLRRQAPAAPPLDEFFVRQFFQPAVNGVNRGTHLAGELVQTCITVGTLPRLPQVQGESTIETLRAPRQARIGEHAQRYTDRVQAVRVELFRRAHTVRASAALTRAHHARAPSPGTNKVSKACNRAASADSNSPINSSTPRSSAARFCAAVTAARAARTINDGSSNRASKTGPSSLVRGSK